MGHPNPIPALETIGIADGCRWSMTQGQWPSVSWGWKKPAIPEKKIRIFDVEMVSELALRWEKPWAWSCDIINHQKELQSDYLFTALKWDRGQPMATDIDWRGGTVYGLILSALPTVGQRWVSTPWPNTKRHWGPSSSHDLERPGKMWYNQLTSQAVLIPSAALIFFGAALIFDSQPVRSLESARLFNVAMETGWTWHPLVDDLPGD